MESFERMAVETTTPGVASTDLDLLLRYAEALAKLGRVRESIHSFDRAARLAASSEPLHNVQGHGMHGHGHALPALLPADRLRILAGALLDQVGGQGQASSDSSNQPRLNCCRELTCLTCPACDCVLQCPVTLACGHTSCRRCLAGLDGRLTCPKCPYRTAPGVQVVTNVLVQRLVERWWSQELRAASLRDHGTALFHDGKVQDALRMYDEAVQLNPASPLLRSNRSHALYCMGRHQQALQDADEAVRLRPAWGKGHYRRGAALTALHRYDEALSAFCACAALERGPQGPQAFRGEVTRVLHRLLTMTLTSRGRPGLGLGPAIGRQGSSIAPRRMGLAWRAPPSCSSDCEDNSSDEEAQARAHAHAKATARGGARGPGRGVSRAAGKGMAAHPHIFQDVPTDPHLDSLLDRVFQDVEKLKRLDGREPLGDSLTVDPRLVDHSELDCVLCCRTLWKPVTTPCGHTYCCMCLDRCLDYSYSCPLCMTSLSEYVSASPRSVTEWVEAALRQAAPRELALRQATHAQELSEQGPSHLQLHRSYPAQAAGLPVPIFVCTTAFPGVPCPLYVYEPRYRLMVRRCVESGTRIFGMAACVYRSGGPDRYAEYGTLLEICDLVRMCDGSAILSTLGSRRFRVLQRGERDGYDVANVQLLQDEPTPAERLPAVRQLHSLVRAKSEVWLSSMGAEVRVEIERSFGEMPGVEEGWENSCDGPAWTWYLLAVLPLGPQLQVGILSTTSVEKRLRAIDKTLDHLAQRIRASWQSS